MGVFVVRGERVLRLLAGLMLLVTAFGFAWSSLELAAQAAQDEPAAQGSALPAMQDAVGVMAGDGQDGVRITVCLPSAQPPLPQPARPAAGAPRVLIYHTHTYEAYNGGDNRPYAIVGADEWRTDDSGYNVVRVGEALAAELAALGIVAVHDTTAFEPPKIGTAYERSLAMLDSRLNAGEEYDLIIDLHRDAYNSTTWAEQSVEVAGVSCARIMFLIGTGEDGFAVKPDWERNLALAARTEQALRGVNEGLSAGITVKGQRYNQHASDRCLLVEAGNNLNALEEVVASMPHLAYAIAQALAED